MKRLAHLLAILVTPLLTVGCDSPAPPAAVPKVRANPAPPVAKGSKPVAKKKKQPGLHSPASSTAPRGHF